MRRVICIALLVLVAIWPRGATPPPDLEGIARDTFQQVSRINTEDGEAEAVSGAMQSVVTQAAALGWTMGEMSEALKQEVAPVFSGRDIRRRWEPFAKWMDDTLDEAETPADAIETLQEMADGLSAAGGA